MVFILIAMAGIGKEVADCLRLVPGSTKPTGAKAEDELELAQNATPFAGYANSAPGSRQQLVPSDNVDVGAREVAP